MQHPFKKENKEKIIPSKSILLFFFLSMRPWIKMKEIVNQVSSTKIIYSCLFIHNYNAPIKFILPGATTPFSIILGFTSSSGFPVVPVLRSIKKDHIRPTAKSYI